MLLFTCTMHHLSVRHIRNAGKRSTHIRVAIQCRHPIASYANVFFLFLYTMRWDYWYG